MADPIRVRGPVSGTERTLTFETGKLAPQSQGAVVASIGETTVLATANAAHDVRPGIDFFPLTVDVEERAYAAGKIPGSFFRREGRPTEDAVLTCRLTDRPLRPSFADGFRNETQVVITVLGADQENPHDVLAINAASAALMISGIPFDGPIGAVRLAYSTDGEWIPHPTYAEGDAGTFELVVAGRELSDGDVAIMMVEAGGSEKSFQYYEEGAPKVDEAVLASGLEASKQLIKESIGLQRQLVASVIATHGPITPIAFTPVVDYTADVFDAVERVATDKLVRRGHDRRSSPTATPPSTRWPTPRSPSSPAPPRRRASTPAARRRSARPCGRSPRSWCASASSRRASASTAGGTPTCGRSRPRSASCRPPMAQACSSAARRR